MKKLLLILIVLCLSFTALTSNNLEITDNIYIYDTTVKWHKSNANDIHVFDPYIGRFRSESKFNEQIKKKIYFIVEYAWYNKQKTVVKTTLSYVIESENQKILNAEGFYGYDPIDNKIYNTQTFVSGVRGYGGIEKFDLKTFSRTTRARILVNDGSIRHVRDEFKIIDANSWKSTTYFRNSDDKWEMSISDVYNRF